MRMTGPRGLWIISIQMPGECQQRPAKTGGKDEGCNHGSRCRWRHLGCPRCSETRRTAGHVLVRVHASSLNRAEFRRLHTLRVQPGQAAPEARTGGGDAAGEVVEIGADVTGIKPGDRVMGRCAGGFAEYALLDAREVMPAPERLSWEEAACVPIVFVVVHDALFVSGQLRAGETLLVTAAPSGVGVAALLLAKYLGAKVIGTSRSAEKLERLKTFGLDAGVVTGSEGFGAAISRVIGEA